MDERGCPEHDGCSRKVERDPDVAPVHAVDDDACERGDHEPGKRQDDGHETHGNGGVRLLQDIPGHPGEVESRAEDGDEDRGEEVAEALLREEGLPVGGVLSGEPAGHDELNISICRGAAQRASLERALTRPWPRQNVLRSES